MPGAARRVRDLGVATTYETLRAALADAFGALVPGADPVLRASDRADYQANGVMAVAKALGEAPRDVAARVVERLDLAGVAAVEVAGPGFLNLTLTPEYLDGRLRELLADDRLGAEADPAATRVLVDYSSPNVAKEMHVGHLRSTVIGDALARLHRFAGHRVTARNHVGDWGTPFGMLIEHLVRPGRVRGGRDPVHRRPRRLLPRRAHQVRRRRGLPRAQPGPRGVAPGRGPRDEAALAGPGRRVGRLLRRGLRQARRDAQPRRRARRVVLQRAP